MQKIRVLIIDDSIAMQKLLTQLLIADETIEVIGVADDPYIARELIKKSNPDVLLLDVEMPRMDGITFLKNLMRLRPMPVIMVSTYTDPGKQLALEALAIGAIDCVGKPSTANPNELSTYAKNLITLVKNAAHINIEAFNLIKQQTNNSRQAIIKPAAFQQSLLQNHIIAIGASTGGIETIEKILTQLPLETPGIVIVQHISKDFAEFFAKRVNDLTPLTVTVATRGKKVLPGHVLIAPSNSHLTIKKYQQHCFCELEEGPPLQGHKPSVDRLFNSLAILPAAQVTALLLTGMGSDGAQGLKAIQNAGGNTIAQDRQSSIVWGMPGSAVKLGAANHVMSVNEIVNYLKNRKYLSS